VIKNEIRKRLPQMTEDEIRKSVLDNIERQGLPLEARASEVLEACGWEVTSQFGYLDVERRKFRTVDIVAPWPGFEPGSCHRACFSAMSSGRQPLILDRTILPGLSIWPKRHHA